MDVADRRAGTGTGLLLRFGACELDRRERRLLRDGSAVPLRARAFDVLVALAERSGRLVTKDELLDQVWHGLVVEENNIAAQIVSLRKALGGDLIATVPGRGYRLNCDVHEIAAGAIAVQAPLSTPAVAAAPPAAPATTPRRPGPQLFGRADDLARLHGTLQVPVCLTLVGPAGVGKTALALALRAAWDGPSAWVDLAAEPDGSHLVGALCRALGRAAPSGDPMPLLTQALDGPAQLLVMDNAEHLVDEVAALADALLARLPSLRLLVTSQVPLRLAQERVDRIQPLPVAPPDVPPADALAEGAIALLIDRIQASDRRLQPGPESLPLLRELCMQLDGLPLALEMAAARVPLLGLGGVRDALVERFAMLSRGHRLAASRHRSLHAALDWSHDLLSASEQRLLAALGACAGSFSLDLAVAVGSEPGAERWDVIDQLATLVDRSLVTVDVGEPPRYRLLETVRAYAREKLAASGREDAVRRRHAEALAAALEECRPGENAVNEFENLRAALAWSQGHDAELALRLAIKGAALATFSLWMPEGARWVAACEPLLPQASKALQARWWRAQAHQLLIRHQRGVAPAARRAAQLNRDLGDAEGLFWSQVILVRSLRAPTDDLDALCAEIDAFAESLPPDGHRERAIAAGTLAMAAATRGDWSATLAFREREAEHMRRAGNRAAEDAARSNMVYAKLHGGRPAEAVEDARALLQSTAGRAPGNEAYVRVYLLSALLKLDRLDEALTEAPPTLALCRRLEMGHATELVALLAARQGRHRTATLLLGHSRATYRRLGAEMGTDDPPFARAEALVRAALPPGWVDALLVEGEALDDDAADRLLFAAADSD